MSINQQEIHAEDRLVADLHQLGVTYLSNRATGVAGPPRAPAQILADTLRRPSSRVRTSAIALLLLHPGYAQAVPSALDLLSEEDRLSLKFFYTAAVFLQQAYHAGLLPLLANDWVWLPDLFSRHLGLAPHLSPQDAIHRLGARHQELTHSYTNWAGTYNNVVHHLIRYKQRELQWNQSTPKPSPPRPKSFPLNSSSIFNISYCD